MTRNEILADYQRKRKLYDTDLTSEQVMNEATKLLGKLSTTLKKNRYYTDALIDNQFGSTPEESNIEFEDGKYTWKIDFDGDENRQSVNVLRHNLEAHELVILRIYNYFDDNPLPFPCTLNRRGGERGKLSKSQLIVQVEEADKEVRYTDYLDCTKGVLLANKLIDSLQAHPQPKEDRKKNKY